MIYFLILILLASVYLIFDYKGPRRIQLKPATVFGIDCLKARDLMVQEYDDAGNLWATRGMILYHLPRSGRSFIRTAHVFAGFSVLWLLNFSFFRRLTNKPECMEMTISSKGDISVFAAGFMLYGNKNTRKFRRTMKLQHFGPGTGRGILSNGLLQVNDDVLFIGEYYRNDERSMVKVYRSYDFGYTWDTAHEFQSGSIRHIHALLKDPYEEKIWICTGDLDDESRIGWSSDDLQTINLIGQGGQAWRTCHLVFSEDNVYWGADTYSGSHSGIYRWDRQQKQLNKLMPVDGAVFFGTRLAKGTIVMSTDREGFQNEKDNKTRLFIICENGEIKCIEGGTWKHKKQGFRFGFAKLRLQRNQGNDCLAISVLNQKELNNSDLILVTEEEIKKKAGGC
jgi:hypothetical protein